MSKADDMQELFKEAAKIAAVVPPSMQEAAFHRALDMLTGSWSSKASLKEIEHKSRDERADRQEGLPSAAAGDRLARVMAVSRDNAPEVDKETIRSGYVHRSVSCG